MLDGSSGISRLDGLATQGFLSPWFDRVAFVLVFSSLNEEGNDSRSIGITVRLTSRTLRGRRALGIPRGRRPTLAFPRSHLNSLIDRDYRDSNRNKKDP